MRLPFVPPYNKIQIDLLLFSNFEDTDADQPTADQPTADQPTVDQPTTVDHDVSVCVFLGYSWSLKLHSTGRLIPC